MKTVRNFGASEKWHHPSHLDWRTSSSVKVLKSKPVIEKTLNSLRWVLKCWKVIRWRTVELSPNVFFDIFIRKYDLDYRKSLFHHIWSPLITLQWPSWTRTHFPELIFYRSFYPHANIQPSWNKFTLPSHLPPNPHCTSAFSTCFPIHAHWLYFALIWQ